MGNHKHENPVSAVAVALLSIGFLMTRHTLAADVPDSDQVSHLLSEAKTQALSDKGRCGHAPVSCILEPRLAKSCRCSESDEGACQRGWPPANQARAKCRISFTMAEDRNRANPAAIARTRLRHRNGSIA